MLNILDFLDKEIYDELKQFSLSCDFGETLNPIDGVLYSGINAKIPDHIIAEVLNKIEKATGIKPLVSMIFLRMSKEGVYAPNACHHDLSHGAYTCILYLNTYEGGGTALVRHADSGITYAPQNQKYLDVLLEGNDVSKWVQYGQANMIENSTAIFDAGMLHCSKPMGGFGATQEDARMVLTCFFS